MINILSAVIDISHHSGDDEAVRFARKKSIELAPWMDVKPLETLCSIADAQSAYDAIRWVRQMVYLVGD